MAKKNNLDFIKVLSQRGLRILPVTKDKVPLVKGGYAAASTDFKQITQWSEHFFDCTWGIQTGRQSGIVVIDLDPRNGSGLTILSLMKQGHMLPKEAPCVYTPQKGHHYYFKYPSNLSISSHTNLLPGLDVISDGKFIMAPCSESIHGFYSRADIDPQTLPELPDWLIDLILENDTPTLTSIPVNPVTTTKGELSKATYRFIAIGHIESWNDELYKSARDCFEQGYTLEETIPMLEPATKASDPTTGLPRDEYLGYFDKKDLRTIESAFSKAPRYEPRTTDTAVQNALYGAIQLKTESEGLAQGGAGVMSVITASTLLEEVSDFLSNKKAIQGLETGVGPLDKLLGGLRESELSIIHGEAKAGKSSFLNALIHGLLKNNHKLGFASREMDPAKEVLPALFSVELQKNAWKSEFTESFKDTIQKIPWLSNLYFAPGYGYIPIEDLSNWVRGLKELGVKVVFLDHLHYSISQPEDHKEAALLIRQIKTLAMETKIHFIVVVQANKLLDDQKLGRNSLKGGSAISQTLNNLITIERINPRDFNLSDPSTAKNVTKIDLQFARSPLATPGHFYMQYNNETTDLQIVELEDAPQESLGPVYQLQRKY